MTNLPDLWPHQTKAVRLVHDALTEGERRICLCQPTGAGKSRVACELIRDWLVSGYNVSLYTNRKMLLDQLARTLKAFGLVHGTRSADAIAHGKMPSDDPLQISSIQTEASRVLRKKVWRLHPAQRIIVDEAHLNAGATAKTLLDLHVQDGVAAYVGLTATPLDIGHMYDHLIVAGTNSELRECGALVPALHYGPDEPDVRQVKKELWEYSENDVRKVMNVQRIFGRIVEWFLKLNPERKPTILFAPGVPESIWLCDHLNAAGITAAHIDGKTCVFKGERYDTSQEIRDEILRASREGECCVLCNRFVLREGIDAPWIEHMILATVFGSLQSYLQSGGRGLRASPGKTRLTVQDHGGAWHRHGSLNADRHWLLGDTEATVQGLRSERLRSGKDAEPAVCPQCRKILMTNRCSCGFELTKRTRPVIQTDGTLREMGGKIFKPRFVKMQPNTQQLWEKMYWRSKQKKRTFNAARGLFYWENGYFPPADLPFMPTNERDWFRRVSDVPRETLR